MHAFRKQCISAVRHFGGCSGMIRQPDCRNCLHFYRISWKSFIIDRKNVCNLVSSHVSPSLTRPDVLPAEERPSEASPCPVAGEYEGVIPDTGDQLGAKLYSDCNSPGIMFYSVLSLDNHSIVYEGEAAVVLTWLQMFKLCLGLTSNSDTFICILTSHHVPLQKFHLTPVWGHPL